MPNSFEDITNPTRHNLLNLVSMMADPRQQFDHLRTELKQSIYDYFNESPPFPTQGSEIQTDISKYIRLIVYCLEAGDTDILKEWGIRKVQVNPSQMLVSTEFQRYRIACQNARRRSKTSLEEDCWTLLIEFFTSLSQLPVQTNAVHRQ